MIDIEKIKSKKSIQELLGFSIINLDKPSGPTSFQVSHHVKNSLHLTKTSHFGTLDPMVSGVLPIALNRACRLNDYFMHRDKEYVGIMRLHSDVSDTLLQNSLAGFIGKIIQLPPKKSRVKRAPREREIKKFEILERDGRDVLFRTVVQAGTYIRKLIHDLGKEIGGAHMLELRRTRAGIFAEETLVNLYDFEKAVNEYENGNEAPLRKILIPAEIVSKVLPVVQLKSGNIKQILTGKPLTSSNIGSVPEENFFALFNGETLIGIYHPVEEKGIVARPNFVLN